MSDLPRLLVFPMVAHVALGRLHSYVQIATTNIRLRGLVFTVNFVAVLVDYAIERGLEVLDQVLGVLDPDRQPYRPLAHAR